MDLRQNIERTIDRHLALLNRLDPHLGCAKCGGPLVDSRCPKCQGDD